MSGGSHGYICWKVEEYAVGQMRDVELNEMIKDLVDVLHDLEWWESGDISQENYRETVTKFKKKWFVDSRDERVERIINEECDKLRQELKSSLLI